ncbi:MAG: lysine--tRNA ligase [Deltaproteobacteria bacterium]|nr:lysine--tRNA ligase [Deltaproteobacteria bacterium]
MSSRPPAQPEKTLDRIMSERREKGVALRAAGSDPYRNDIGPAIGLAEVRARYADTKPPAPPPRDPDAPKVPKGEKTDEVITPIDGTPLRVGGRVMAKRGFGKVVFAPIRDTAGELQLYLGVDHLAAADFESVLPNLDTGDIVVAEGPAFWTKRGELSILVNRLWIATKSLRPLPSKEWEDAKGKQKGGLTDIEARYRQRYVDLAVSVDVREVFRKRSAIVSGIRRFLDDRNYLEVETPMMHSIIGGAAARPFKTHHNALDIDLFMRIAPELHLKRLVVGGFDRVYEINRNFRNEGLSRQHNPEFTMLEFYQAYATYTDLMDLTETMIGELATRINGTTTATWDGVEIDLSPGWRRLPIKEAVRELGGIAEADQVFEDPAVAAEVALANGVPAADIVRVLLAGVPADKLGDLAHTAVTASFKQPDQRVALARSIIERYDSSEQRRITAGHLGYLVFEATAEAKLVQPTFLTQFPLAVSPLARKNDADGAFCDRFELFVNGKEIANGFSELNDPDDQRARFQAQVNAKAVGADETMDYDEDYCRALEIGLPPTAGEGIGIDRLAMLLTGQSSIRDVILFPLMRPE